MDMYGEGHGGEAHDPHNIEQAYIKVKSKMTSQALKVSSFVFFSVFVH